MFTVCGVYCPICRCEMDWMKSWGRDFGCCGEKCYREFEWRRTLATLGKRYYPDPRTVKTPPDDTQKHFWGAKFKGDSHISAA